MLETEEVDDVRANRRLSTEFERLQSPIAKARQSFLSASVSARRMPGRGFAERGMSLRITSSSFARPSSGRFAATFSRKRREGRLSAA